MSIENSNKQKILEAFKENKDLIIQIYSCGSVIDMDIEEFDLEIKDDKIIVKADFN